MIIFLRRNKPRNRAKMDQDHPITDAGVQYPASLRYLMTSLRGWSTNVTRLLPEGIREAMPNSHIVFTMPEQQMIQLSSFCILMDAQGIKGDANGDECVFPRNSFSFIDQLTVSINGQVIDNITGYNHLAHLMHDMTGGKKLHNYAPLMLTKNIDPAGHLGPGGELLNKNRLASVGVHTALGMPGTHGITRAELNDSVVTDYWATTGTGGSLRWRQNAYTYAFFDFMGFLNCGRWLDVSTLGRVEITLRLAPESIVRRRQSVLGTENGVMGGAALDVSTTPASYRMTNIRGLVNVASLDDGAYYQTVAARLAQAPLQIPFKRWMFYNNPVLTGSGSVRFSINTMSLDAIYAWLVESNPDGVQNVKTARLPLMLNPGATNQNISGGRVLVNIPSPIPADGNVPLQIVVNTDQPNMIGPITENEIIPHEFFIRHTEGNAQTGTVYLKGVQAIVNSVAYPPFPMSPDEMYYQALNTFRAFDDKELQVSPYMSWEYWNKYACFFSHRFSYGKGLDWTSGVDARGVALTGSIEFKTEMSPGQTPTFNRRPIIFAECTSLLQAGSYRSVSIVP